MSRNVKIPTAGPGESYASQLAIIIDRTDTTGPTVEQARQVAHDQLIAKLGRHRRSGVWWTQHHPAQALRQLDELVGPKAADRDHIRELLSNPRSLMVVAWAVAALPAGRPL